MSEHEDTAWFERLYAAAESGDAEVPWVRGGPNPFLEQWVRGGARTLYAHLSQVGVRLGQTVQTGWRIGRVGATGYATGAHLHFELRVRGAAVDPLPALP